MTRRPRLSARRQRRAARIAFLACALAALAPSVARAASLVPDKPVHTWRRPAPEIDEVLFTADLALASDGSILLLDTYGCRVLRLSPAGDVRDAFGGCGREPGRLFLPDGLVASPDGTIYVAERARGPRVREGGWPSGELRHGRVQAFDASGRLLHVIDRSTTVTSPPDLPGRYALPAELYGIGGIAVDARGILHVVDAKGARWTRYDAEGRLLDAAWLRGGVGHVPPLWAGGGLATSEDGRIAWSDGDGQLWQLVPGDPAGPRLLPLSSRPPRGGASEGGAWRDLRPAADGGWWMLQDRRLLLLDARGQLVSSRDLFLPWPTEATLGTALEVLPGGRVVVGLDLRGESLGYGQPGGAAALHAVEPDGFRPLWGRAPADSAWSLGRAPRGLSTTADGGLALLTSASHGDARRPYPASRSIRVAPPPPPSGILRLDRLGAVDLDRLDSGLGPDAERRERPFPSGIAPAAEEGLLVADPGHRRLVRYDAQGERQDEIPLDGELPVSLRAAADGRVFSLDLDGALVERDALGRELSRASLTFWDGLGLFRGPWASHVSPAFPFGLAADGRRVWHWDWDREDEEQGFLQWLRAVDLPGGQEAGALPLPAISSRDGLSPPGDLRLDGQGRAYLETMLGCGRSEHATCIARVDLASGALETLWPVQDPALDTVAAGHIALPEKERLLVARADYGTDPRSYDRRMEIAVWERDWPRTWRAETFAGPHLAGRPAETRAVADAELGAWHAGLPAGGSARLERPLVLEGGTYDIRLAAPGGARLWLDGELLVDAWRAEGVDEIHELFLSGTWAHRVLLELRVPNAPAGQDAFALSFARRGPAQAIYLPWTTAAWGRQPIELPVPAPSPTPEAYPGP